MPIFTFFTVYLDSSEATLSHRIKQFSGQIYVAAWQNFAYRTPPPPLQGFVYLGSYITDWDSPNLSNTVDDSRFIHHKTVKITENN